MQILERPRSTDGDTVDTELDGELVLLLRDSAGRPDPDAGVGLRGLAPAGVPFFTPLLRFRDASDPESAWSDIGSYAPADAQGVVRVKVALGQVAGEILLEIMRTGAGGLVPQRPTIDTIAFTVRPGRPAAVELLPGDSAVYVGRSYQLRTRVFDRHGNTRVGERPATSTATAAITVNGTGLLTGVHIGRGIIRAAIGNVKDSAFVSVVPQGVIAATRPNFGDRGPQLLQFELDGSDFRVVHDRRIESPSWSPTGSTLAFVDFGGANDFFYGGRLKTRTAGVDRILLQGQVETDYVYAPHFSHDEAWVYFAGTTFWGSIMRVRKEGGTPEMVVPRNPDGYTGFHHPSPSSDGRYLAYVAYANCCDVNGLRILNFVTGATAQGPLLWNPEWLPAGTILGYRNTGATGFVEVNPEGTILREYPFHLIGASPFDLSPDARWVIVSTDLEDMPGRRMLVLYELATGLTLPLGYSVDFGMPAWRP
jgi:hypothetical protein